MATSPIYSWPEPDNTDLVKNGALAIRTLGNAIDTTMGTMVAKTVVDAKGDLIAGTAADTVNRLAVGANGETLVADSSTSTGLRYQTSSNFNYVVNGGMDIWQRGTTFTSTGSSLFGADRWKFQVSSNGVMSQETSDTTNGFRYALKYAAGASNTYLQMGTQIEFQQCENLQNQTVVLSFWAKALNSNAGSTGLTVRTRTAAGIDGAALFAGSNTDTSVTLTTSWVRYSVTRTYTTFGAISMEFVLGSHASGDGFLLAGVQLEQGSVPTTFKKSGGTLAGELQACQRYYFRTTGQSAASNDLLPATMFSSTSITGVMRFPVPMRTAATCSFSAAGDFQFVWSAGTSTISGANIDRTSTESLNLRLTSTGLTTNGGGYVAIATGATKWLEASAELG